MTVVLVETTDRVAVVTLNRPESRNALSQELRHTLWDTMGDLDADDDVDVVVITGADPAFCAGIDLRELGSASTGERWQPPQDPTGLHRYFPKPSKPVIGAVNGPAATGGLELALQCSFLVASDRARFADTHARVGVMPGGGMSVFLPSSVGLRRAIEMSLSGNFVDADQALRWGLVNHVVPHEDLLPFCRKLAADIAGNDQDGVRRMLATYQEVADTVEADGLRAEDLAQAGFKRRPAEEIGRRREAIIKRGSDQAR